MIPIVGSAYTYAYATPAKFCLIIGWDLILEHAVSNMAAAVGILRHFNDFPRGRLRRAPGLSSFRAPHRRRRFTGNWFNLPTLLLCWR
jgi:APA family basic amino acid/polyamine antiporter